MHASNSEFCTVEASIINSTFDLIYILYSFGRFETRTKTHRHYTRPSLLYHLSPEQGNNHSYRYFTSKESNKYIVRLYILYYIEIRNIFDPSSVYLLHHNLYKKKKKN